MKAVLLAASAAGVGAPAAPLHGPSVEAVSSLQVSAGYRVGEMPPFSASERDIGAFGLGGRWAPHPSVELRAAWEGLRATWPAGNTALGSGDLHLGTRARPYAGAGAVPGVWLDWEVKLPNAPEDTGLGTDETDVLGLLYLAWSGERRRLQAGGGLAILGSPVQHAAQDDAALVHARGALMLGPTWLSAGLDGRLASPRNPLDLSLDVGASWTRGRLQLGVEGLAGLSPAAPDYGGRLVVGLVPLPEGS